MYNKRIQYEIGQRVRETRRRQDATQMQFSEEIYITPNFLSEIENGKKGMSCETIYNLCETQEIPADYLLFGDARKTNVSYSETIIESASHMNVQELGIVIQYLDSLKNMREKLN